MRAATTSTTVSTAPDADTSASAELERLGESWRRTQNPVHVWQALLVILLPAKGVMELPDWCDRYLVQVAYGIWDLTTQLPSPGKPDRSVRGSPPISPDKCVAKLPAVLGFAGRSPFREFAAAADFQWDASFHDVVELLDAKVGSAQKKLMRVHDTESALSPELERLRTRWNCKQNPVYVWLALRLIWLPYCDDPVLPEIPGWCAAYLIGVAYGVLKLTIDLPSPSRRDKRVAKLPAVLGFAGQQGWNPFREYAADFQKEWDATFLDGVKLLRAKAGTAVMVHEKLMQRRNISDAVTSRKRVALGRRARGRDMERLLAEAATLKPRG